MARSLNIPDGLNGKCFKLERQKYRIPADRAVCALIFGHSCAFYVREIRPISLYSPGLLSFSGCMALFRRFRFRTFFLITTATVLVLGGVLFWLIHYPAVQTYLVEKSEYLLESLLDAEVTIGVVDIALPINGQLKQVQIETESGEPIGRMKSLNLNLLSFSLWKFILNNQEVHALHISSLEVEGLQFELIRNKAGVLNIVEWLGPSTRDQRPSTRLLSLEIEDLSVKDAEFSFIDSTRLRPDSLPSDRFHPTEMALKTIDLDAAITVGPGRAFNGNIRHLSATDQISGLEVDHLTMQVEADTLHHRDRRGWKEVTPYVSLKQVEIREGPTRLSADITFPRTELADLLRGDLLYRYFEANWYNSYVHTNSIQRFVPQKLPIFGRVSLHGRTMGTINDLYSPGLSVTINEYTDLFARFRLSELLHPKNTHLDIHLTKALLRMADVRAFVPQSGIPARLDSLQLKTFEGHFRGHYKDFQVTAETDTDPGHLATDLHIILPPRAREPTYEGWIETLDINPTALGFGDVIDSRYLNMRSDIHGKGTSIRDLTTSFNGKVWNSNLWGYRVDSLLANVTVEDKRIVGDAFGIHNGGKADVAVDLDLGAAPATYAIRGGLENIDMATYNLLEEPMIISTRIIADFMGNSLEQVTGNFGLTKSSVTNSSGRVFHFDKSNLRVDRNSEGEKHFALKSPMADADLLGNFTLNKLRGLAGMLVKESGLYFSNEDSLIQTYYETKVVDTLTTTGELRLSTNTELNEFLHFLQVPVDVADSSTLDLDFTFGDSEEVRMDMRSDSIRFQTVLFEGVTGDGTLFKNAFDNRLGLLGGLDANQVNLGQNRYLNKAGITLEGIDRQFDGQLLLRQDAEQNALTIKTFTKFLKDGSITTRINDISSKVVVSGDTLEFMANNEVILLNETVDIHNIVLQSTETYFRLDGLISENPRDVLTFTVGQLPLSVLNDFIELSFVPEGMFNLEVRMQQLLTNPCLSLTSRVDRFALDDYAYGEIFTIGHWQSSTGHLQLNATLWDGQDTTLNLLGYYDIPDSVAPLHFELLTKNGFPLDYAHPFVKTQLYDLQGTVDLDEFTILGSPFEPIVLGTGHFTDAGFGVDYFKTTYSFGGSITFDNDRIEFPRIRLYDQNRNFAQLYGYIYHKGLSDFRFDLQLEQARNFQLMDTRKGDNELFYGRLFLRDGVGSVNGNLDKLRLEMFATSGRGSFLKIPLEDTGGESRPDFIRFSGEQVDRGTYKTGLKDFEIDLNISMTPDLEVDLIFDEKVGDIIRGKGIGNISMFINESGEFTMFGEYQITEGNYLFTAQNILNKKFEVKPGGTIVWNGDPYDAQLNLNAYYPLYADISQLLQEQRTIRTPVNVNMAMNGSLLAPKIDLSIELPSLTEGDATQISSYLKSIQYDEQELNKQVFSLMVFNRFAPVGGFLAPNAASSGVTTSISEMISNQLNYWLGQAIGENVNIGVATNNFQDVNLLLSASLFDDRVVIERDGTLIDGNGNDNGANLAIGNVSVQIKLLPARNAEDASIVRQSELILEVFTRESLNADLNNNNYQAGAGVFYKKDFDKVGELFERQRKNQ